LSPARSRRVRNKSYFLGALAGLHFLASFSAGAETKALGPVWSFLVAGAIAYLLSQCYRRSQALERRFLLALAYFFGVTSSLVAGPEVQAQIHAYRLDTLGTLALVGLSVFQRRRLGRGAAANPNAHVPR